MRNYNKVCPQNGEYFKVTNSGEKIKSRYEHMMEKALSEVPDLFEALKQMLTF